MAKLIQSEEIGKLWGNEIYKVVNNLRVQHFPMTEELILINNININEFALADYDEATELANFILMLVKEAKEK